MNDLDYMKLAYNLAAKGRGTTSPNPMVGAVVVKDGKVIAQAWHKRCGGPHAEVVALDQAGEKARGAKLYVTLEPCFHYGRTPPCADKIIAAGIREVIIGIKDPNPLVNGRSILKLRRAGIKVHVFISKFPSPLWGGLGSPAAAGSPSPSHEGRGNHFNIKELIFLNEAFFKYIQSQMPFVTAKIAQTLDGKIAARTGQSQWITSAKTRDGSRRLRDDYDAILVGINTVLKDNPGLDPAGRIKKPRALKKIILDSSLRIPLNAKLFEKTSPANCIIATLKSSHPRKLDTLRKRGIHVMICPQKQGRIDLHWLMQQLAQQEITNILIEGGAQVIGCALKEKLVDKLHVFIAPKIIGDQNALSSVDGLQIAHVDQAIKVSDIKISRIDQDIFLEGYVKY